MSCVEGNATTYYYAYAHSFVARSLPAIVFSFSYIQVLGMPAKIKESKGRITHLQACFLVYTSDYKAEPSQARNS